jgi:hypothetical protein
MVTRAIRCIEEEWGETYVSPISIEPPLPVRTAHMLAEGLCVLCVSGSVFSTVTKYGGSQCLKYY